MYGIHKKLFHLKYRMLTTLSKASSVDLFAVSYCLTNYIPTSWTNTWISQHLLIVSKMLTDRRWVNKMRTIFWRDVMTLSMDLWMYILSLFVKRSVMSGKMISDWSTVDRNLIKQVRIIYCCVYIYIVSGQNKDINIALIIYRHL